LPKDCPNYDTRAGKRTEPFLSNDRRRHFDSQSADERNEKDTKDSTTFKRERYSQDMPRITSCKKRTRQARALTASKVERTTFSQLLEYARNLTAKRNCVTPNGVRYPRVGGTRQRRFTGTNLKPRKLPENAQTPTRRVHAVLGGF
jgi:hypothetical protein